MKTLSLNVEIKEENKDNGKLKDDFKLNAEVNFMKTLLDFVKEGNDITIKKLKFSEQKITFYNKVEAIDPDTQKKSILKEKVQKDCYNCTSIINLHKYVKLPNKQVRTDLIPAMKLDGKLEKNRG